MVISQMTTDPAMAPNMPQVWARSTDLISPPMAMENAEPMSGRNGQLETSHVWTQSVEPSQPVPQPFSRPEAITA